MVQCGSRFHVSQYSLLTQVETHVFLNSAFSLMPSGFSTSADVDVGVEAPVYSMCSPATCFSSSMWDDMAGCVQRWRKEDE